MVLVSRIGEKLSDISKALYSESIWECVVCEKKQYEYHVGMIKETEQTVQQQDNLVETRAIT